MLTIHRKRHWQSVVSQTRLGSPIIAIHKECLCLDIIKIIELSRRFTCHKAQGGTDDRLLAHPINNYAKGTACDETQERQQ